MPKLGALVTGGSLGLALVIGSAAISVPAQAAPVIAPVGQPALGNLDQIGGPLGWTEANAEALTEHGLDPSNAVVVDAETTLDGTLGTVSLTNDSDWTEGAVVGDAVGQFTLETKDVEIDFDDDVEFFTSQDLFDLMPTLTFSVATYGVNDHIQYYWGHYALDMDTGEIVPDDNRNPDTPNGHEPLTVKNAGRIDNTMKDFPLVTNEINRSIETVLAEQDLFNLETQQIYQVAANTVFTQQIEKGLGTASVPFNFGYTVDGLTAGHSVTVDLEDVDQDLSSELTNLSGQATEVPVNFSQFDWRDTVDASTIADLDTIGLTEALDQAFDEAFNYDDLLSVFTERSMDQLRKAFRPMAMGFIDGISESLNEWEHKNMGSPPERAGLYAVLYPDRLIGETEFTKAAQAPLEMYPNLADELTEKIIALVQERVANDWYEPVQTNIIGTATVVKTFTATVTTQLDLVDLSGTQSSGGDDNSSTGGGSSQPGTPGATPNPNPTGTVAPSTDPDPSSDVPPTEPPEVITIRIIIVFIFTWFQQLDGLNYFVSLWLSPFP
ncbi:MAG: hypothetical protein LBL92_05915 [Propionibacteriaceae bacterium]|jgi:hypothetical protein|nr:hypothetical protein [Propionibacteriaceae bacterium]